MSEFVVTIGCVCACHACASCSNTLSRHASSSRARIGFVEVSGEAELRELHEIALPVDRRQQHHSRVRKRGIGVDALAQHRAVHVGHLEIR